MQHAIAAMAHQGNNFIVDDVILGGGKAGQYRETLSRHEVHFVGLFALLDVLEGRERERGNKFTPPPFHHWSVPIGSRKSLTCAATSN
jgi:chloramphenicol 3-O phosphotransferase